MSTWKSLLDQAQNLLTVSYLGLIIIGLSREVIYYSQFGINIIEYSEVFDFLISPFKSWFAIAILLTVIFGAIGGYRMDLWMQRKWPKWHKRLNFGISDKPWFENYRKWSYLSVFVTLYLFYNYNHSHRLAEKLRDQQTMDVEVIFSTGAGKAIQGKKIGANAAFLFIMDETNGVAIIPKQSNIEQIRNIGD